MLNYHLIKSCTTEKVHEFHTPFCNIRQNKLLSITFFTSIFKSKKLRHYFVSFFLHNFIPFTFSMLPSAGYNQKYAKYSLYYITAQIYITKTNFTLLKTFHFHTNSLFLSLYLLGVQDQNSRRYLDSPADFTHYNGTLSALITNNLGCLMAEGQ